MRKIIIIIITMAIFGASCKTTDKINYQIIKDLKQQELNNDPKLVNQSISIFKTSSFNDYSQNRENIPSISNLKVENEGNILDVTTVTTQTVSCIIELYNNEISIRVFNTNKVDNKAKFRYALYEVPEDCKAIYATSSIGSDIWMILWDPSLSLSSDKAESLIVNSLEKIKKGDYEFPLLKGVNIIGIRNSGSFFYV